MVAMGVAPWGVVRNRDTLTNPKVGFGVLEGGAGGLEPPVCVGWGLGLRVRGGMSAECLCPWP